MLRRLGADFLTDRFTNGELKSAFRVLARRFHPDRHPGSSDAERSHLARSFAAACDAYRTLVPSVH
jgi:DnaJ-class molecular chaperone